MFNVNRYLFDFLKIEDTAVNIRSIVQMSSAEVNSFKLITGDNNIPN